MGRRRLARSFSGDIPSANFDLLVLDLHARLARRDSPQSFLVFVQIGLRLEFDGWEGGSRGRGDGGFRRGGDELARGLCERVER